ncbi:uncharacterized protein METZ01_LOCUS133449 [marine metagenome]|uniref:Uncharacterized protein n=1 Tax=marine metagenome TaxID=408172 RepID=A0A381YUA6_9ZZZZ
MEDRVETGYEMSYRAVHAINAGAQYHADSTRVVTTYSSDLSGLLLHLIARVNGAPGRIRTCDPRLRRPMLYPTELRAHYLHSRSYKGRRKTTI